MKQPQKDSISLDARSQHQEEDKTAVSPFDPTLPCQTLNAPDGEDEMMAGPGVQFWGRFANSELISVFHKSSNNSNII